ncbi:class C sortase [Bifidobacterium choloepi]|nr:class C sortase [Bifidobacterium choloepi]
MGNGSDDLKHELFGDDPSADTDDFFDTLHDPSDDAPRDEGAGAIGDAGDAATGGAGGDSGDGTVPPSSGDPGNSDGGNSGDGDHHDGGDDGEIVPDESSKQLDATRRKHSNTRFYLTIVAMILLLLVGVGLILYPSIADAWNRHVSSKAVAGYVEAVENMSTEERDAQLAKANAYNAALVGRGTSRFIPTDAEHEEYESILDVTGTGIMGYVTIPKISVRVPIYHGTSDTVLQIAAGHLEGSSLPVGGPSTHAAISGHTGLPSALLFTGLDRLKEGDTFTITVFDEVLTYEVSEINVVEPTDVSDLEIKEGEDLVSLITCTPYGVNSHRLIVTGHRIPTPTADDADPGIDQALVKDIAMIVAALVIIGGTVAAIFLRRHFRLKKAAEAAAGLTGGGKHAARK